MKKIISLIISAVVICVSLSGYAAGSSEISVTSANVSTGNNVKVDVKINNNPGIASYKLKLNFDPTKLVPVSIYGSEITSNIQQPGVDLSGLSYVSAVWVSESNLNMDVVLFSVEFKAISAVDTIAYLTLSYTEGEICDQNLEDVNPALSEGTITIQSKPEPTATHPTETPAPTAIPTAQPTANCYTISNYDGNSAKILRPAGSPDNEKVLAIAAKYNSYGVLADCEIINAVCSGSETDILFSKGIMPQNGEVVKLMLWSDNLVPLMTSLDI